MATLIERSNCYLISVFYEKVEIDYLHECENLRDFCEQNDIEIETFKQDLLDRIENKLRSGSNMPNYYENNLQEFDHKRSIYETVAQLPSVENTDKVIRYETHLQRSIEKNLRLLRSLQGFGQMSFVADKLVGVFYRRELGYRFVNGALVIEFLDAILVIIRHIATRA